jgi:hypothetical protein
LQEEIAGFGGKRWELLSFFVESGSSPVRCFQSNPVEKHGVKSIPNNFFRKTFEPQLGVARFYVSLNPISTIKTPDVPGKQFFDFL